MVLIIGYTAIAAVLITVGIDTSKVFLAQRALASAADSAALAAAQGVERQAIYAGAGLRCGQPLPLDQQHAAELATGVGRARRGRSEPHVRHARRRRRPRCTGGTVSVELSG